MSGALSTLGTLSASVFRKKWRGLMGLLCARQPLVNQNCTKGRTLWAHEPGINKRPVMLLCKNFTGAAGRRQRPEADLNTRQPTLRPIWARRTAHSGVQPPQQTDGRSRLKRFHGHAWRNP